MLLLFILVFTDFSDFLRGAEQTAGGIDVLAAAGTDGGEDAMLGEVITELLHLLIIHTCSMPMPLSAGISSARSEGIGSCICLLYTSDAADEYACV